MKIEMDDEFVDHIVASAIKEHISYVKKNIRELKKKKNLKDFEQQDLGYNVKLLASLQDAHGYFGGNL